MKKISFSLFLFLPQIIMSLVPGYPKLDLRNKPLNLIVSIIHKYMITSDISESSLPENWFCKTLGYYFIS